MTAVPRRRFPEAARYLNPLRRFVPGGLWGLIQSPFLISKIAMASRWTYNLADCEWPIAARHWMPNE